MHISEELNRINAVLGKQQPETKEEFVSLLARFKEKPPEAKAKEDLKRFDIMVTRKPHLPVFKASKSHLMCFNGDEAKWVVDDVSRINELLRGFLKNRMDFVTVVLYDNILPSPKREERWILKYDNGIVSLNRLHEYDAVVKEKYLKEIDAIPAR